MLDFAVLKLKHTIKKKKKLNPECCLTPSSNVAL
jgi:hypothetical protein